MAFTRWQDGQDGAFGSLWLVNVDGGDERAILDDVRQPKAPVWSPDGSQIAISLQHGGWLEPKRVCGHERPPAKAYDIEVIREGPGQVKYCYTLPPDPFWALRLVEVATGEFRDLPHDAHSFSPAWDPANPWRLVYDGDLGLVNLDLTRSESGTWALTGDVADHGPVFSPDGSRIAVSYWQNGHWEIHLLNADGSGRVRLTDTPLRVIAEQRLASRGEEPRPWNNVAPVWSPDSSQIAFLTDRTGRWELWVMDADGGNQQPLLPPGALDGLTLQFNHVDERVFSWR